MDYRTVRAKLRKPTERQIKAAKLLAEPGKTITAAMTEADALTLGELDIEATVYDLAGNVVATGGLTDGAFGEGSTQSDSSDMGASILKDGRYLVKIKTTWTQANALSLSSKLNVSFTITSDDELSVNPIQALYDIGLECPGRLNEGDSCPE